jgi:diguanylate cyclase (GGDEF)-like protein
MKKKGADTKAGGRSVAAVKRRNGGGGGKPAKKAGKKAGKKTVKKAVKKAANKTAKKPVKTPAKVRTASRAAPTAALKSARDKESVRRLRRALSRALKLIQQLQASAETDYLLDILNRRGFERELTRALAYIKRYHVSAALVVLDVDRLKPINDEFGHGAGDEVLKAIVGVLKAQVRASDVVGRLGGDEFALLLWNLNETEARAKAAALEQAIDRLAFLFGKSRVMAGASAGVAMLGTQVDSSKALEAADGAMYQRKAQRRHER